MEGPTWNPSTQLCWHNKFKHKILWKKLLVSKLCGIGLQVIYCQGAKPIINRKVQKNKNKEALSVLMLYTPVFTLVAIFISDFEYFHVLS